MKLIICHLKWPPLGIFQIFCLFTRICLLTIQFGHWQIKWFSDIKVDVNGNFLKTSHPSVDVWTNWIQICLICLKSLSNNSPGIITSTISWHYYSTIFRHNICLLFHVKVAFGKFKLFLAVCGNFEEKKPSHPSMEDMQTSCIQRYLLCIKESSSYCHAISILIK